MLKIPIFRLYGQGDPQIEEYIQPALGLRQWVDLGESEKETAFHELENGGWLEDYSPEVLQTIEYLNYNFLRQCPGKNLHLIQPKDEYRSMGNQSERMRAALVDFRHIFLNEESDAMVFRMFTKFMESHIDGYRYGLAEKEEDQAKRSEYIEQAFKKFDRLSNMLNHIFEQFAVNVVATRNGLVPRQDERISETIYLPTLEALSDPKWKTVSDNLSRMFDDYRKENYPEVITKAHSVVQRFLQILVGEEGKSGKGEVGKLFNKTKQEGVVPIDRFTEPIVVAFQSFITSERATNSTAKPALKDATSSDALLMMNVVMVFLQHCLQKAK
ncbi:MAG: hypothetical protein HY974_03245 [Candidatus Kerfeldbacteria bacterium]|nr:hypothetical protein [Candidatus Kerfeldbacteria bacterium]